MGLRKKTRITVETDQVVIIRRRTAHRGWCRDCAATVEFVPLQVAARLSLSDPHTLASEARAGKVHLHHSTDGSLLLCLGPDQEPNR